MTFIACRTQWMLRDNEWVDAGEEVFLNSNAIVSIRQQCHGVVRLSTGSVYGADGVSVFYCAGDARGVVEGLVNAGA